MRTRISRETYDKLQAALDEALLKNRNLEKEMALFRSDIDVYKNQIVEIKGALRATETQVQGKDLALQVKNRMLDDQNEHISKLKHTITEKDRELTDTKNQNRC
eukprot:GDKI01013716.1.p1 GENE.GDKI01013716.1~~GDKI01013716.1.p1  ORF type:complete len:118 (+),score=23.70 GDKI01013716.1:45-356(+)